VTAAGPATATCAVAVFVASAVDAAVTVAVPGDTAVTTALLPFGAMLSTAWFDEVQVTVCAAPFVTVTVAVNVAVCPIVSREGVPLIDTAVTDGVVKPPPPPSEPPHATTNPATPQTAARAAVDQFISSSSMSS